MKTTIYWTICCSFLTKLSTADETVWTATCFEESYASGRAVFVEDQETSVTAKTVLDGI